jgi:hypothetical protein
MRDEINNAVKRIEYPEVKEALQIYSKEGRPFALPSFKVQERSSIKQRTADLLGGFPFTSDAYPWPVGGKDGLHMQPIIQINLEKAGQLLNFNFGEGLLQLWGVVGKDDKSFDIIELAFDSDKTKGVHARIIPIQESINKPCDFYPDFSPWLKVGNVDSDRKGHLFVEPSQPMADGSIVSWRLSKQFMYPTPIYDLHDIKTLLPNPAEISEGVDDMDLFDELKAAIGDLLKTPLDGGKCYLGGVRGYGDGRYADPAQGYPVLLSINGEISISVIFDDSISTKPERTTDTSSTQIHFSRENKLRVVYSYNE